MAPVGAGPQFWITVDGGFADLTLSLHGELDLAYQEYLVTAASQQLSGRHSSVITIDLGGLSFLGASGITALLSIKEVAERSGVRFTVRNVPAMIERLFLICGVAVDLGAAPDRTGDGARATYGARGADGAHAR